MWRPCPAGPARRVGPCRQTRQRRPPRAAPAPARPGTGDFDPEKIAEKARIEPARTVQFQLQVMILTEPRMSLNRVGPLQLQEATDDLGNSLLPAAAGYVMPMAVGGAIGFNATGPYFATAIAVLDRPQNAGRLIKTLRGTVEIAVAARRSDTLVIPWQGAAGKTFQNDALHVVVDSITSDAARKQDVIVLSIEEIDQLFPGQSDNGPREPGVGGMGGFSTPQRFARAMIPSRRFRSSTRAVRTSFFRPCAIATRAASR